ncbi:MAG: glycosyltransferase family 2 protein [Armatimonadota bacterium]
MPGTDLSVTICSWNTRDYLDRCIASVLAQADGIALEVIVIDNASEDGSAEMVEQKYPSVRLLRNDQNRGFGAGHNQGFAVASGEFLMPLNSDAIVHPSCLERLVSFLRQHEDVGIAAPKLLNPDGSLQYSGRRFPTPAAALFRNTPLGKLFPNNRFAREYLMQDWDHLEPRDVDWVSGAALCLRADVYHEVGGFDERFFMYLEDVDLCRRVHDAGHRVVYVPDAVITHVIGASTDRVANRMIRQFHKSMLLYYAKHHLRNAPLLLQPLYWLAALLFVWLRASTFLAKNAWDAVMRRVNR